MSKKQRKNQQRARDEPMNKRSVAWVTSGDYSDLTCSGYTSLSQNPEICAAVGRIASLIGTMTIHLMENTVEGDIRVKNELAKKLDINPNEFMTRSNFVQWIVKTMMLDGNGNAVVYPKTRAGILKDLIPIPAGSVSFLPNDSWGYKVSIGGRQYDPGDVLHFVLNPDSYFPWMGTGYRVALSDVANNLKQAAATERGFMSSKWKPSIIVKVDALTEEFSSPTGRKRLLEEYVQNSEAGEPWIIPSEQFSVQEVRPLSLSDLALSDVVQLNKRAVAAILGVPPFVLGIGEFDRWAWNNFINATIMPIAKTIEQELTKKLLYKPEWFFRFNPRSLYNYDLRDLAEVAGNQYDHGIMSGNEVRDWLGLPPAPGLDKMVMLENYVPASMIGKQKKLNGGETE